MTASTADFFGGGATLAPPVVRAPKKSAATIAVEKSQAATRARVRRDAVDLQRKVNNNAVQIQKAKDARIELDRHNRLMADQGSEGQRYRALEKQIKSTRADWGLIPLGAAVIGTGVAVIATGGAAAGALGVTAAASTAAAATTASQAISAATRAAKTADSIGKGNLRSAGGAATTALSSVGVKLPPLPSAAKVGGEVMAGLSLPKLKVSVPSAKDVVAKAKATAKKTASSVVKQAKTTAKKTATQAVKAATTTARTASAFSVPMAAQTAAQKAAATAAAGKAKLEGAKKLLAASPAAIKPKSAVIVKTAPRKLSLAAPMKPPSAPKVAKPPAASKPVAAAPAKKTAAAPVTKGKPQKGIFIPLNGVLDLKTREWVAAG